jgi:transposase
MSLSGDQDLAERDFHSIKADDLDLPPAFRRFEERVKAHVLMCMLACYPDLAPAPRLGVADLH